MQRPIHIISKPIEEIQAKDFFAYHLIENGNIKAATISEYGFSLSIIGDNFPHGTILDSLNRPEAIIT